MTLAPLFATLTDLLFPPACAGCGRLGTTFCATCAQAVQPISGLMCARCGRQQHQAVARCSLCADQQHIVAIRAAAVYAEPLRSAIHALKYSHRPELAAPLARYLAATVALPEWREIVPRLDGTVPVPMVAAREQERGYNQALLLARAFCEQTTLPLREAWLTRIHFERQQAGLNARERRLNVQNAFAASAAVRGQTLLLVDDVYTTGSTLMACAQAAMQAGARAVYGLALSLPTSLQADSSQRAALPPFAAQLSNAAQPEPAAASISL